MKWTVTPHPDRCLSSLRPSERSFCRPLHYQLLLQTGGNKDLFPVSPRGQVWGPDWRDVDKQRLPYCSLKSVFTQLTIYSFFLPLFAPGIIYFLLNLKVFSAINRRHFAIRKQINWKHLFQIWSRFSRLCANIFQNSKFFLLISSVFVAMQIVLVFVSNTTKQS